MAVRTFKPKHTNHSDLMKAISRKEDGDVINRCPFGCEDEQLDEHGYCDHLLGFTVPGDDTIYEPLEKLFYEGGEPRGWLVRGAKADRKKVPAGAKLDLITVNSRVYHKAGREPKE